MSDSTKPAASIAAPTAFHELPRRQVIATMAGVMSAMFMAALDQTIVGTAMPRIIADLHGFEHYAGVLTAYMVASTAVVPIAGKLSDQFGRKWFLLGGVAVFVAASLLCGAAQSMMQLIAFRGLQGLGAGLSQAMAFTTIADLFPPDKRGRISGVMGAVFGLSSVIGPAVGGFLTDGPGWRYVFYVNIPVGFVAAFLIWRFFPTFRRDQKVAPKVDVIGAVTLVGGVVPLLLALSWGGRDYAWSSPVTIGLLVGGVVMTIVFLMVERRAPEPILPLNMFSNSVVAVSVTSASLVSIGMFGAMLFMPLFIQIVIGSSATKSGAVQMPMMFAMIASSATAGQFISRRGKYRFLAIFGVAMTGVGLLLMALMGPDTSYLTVVRNMVIMGIGLGATMPVFTLAVQNAVEVRYLGAATSTVQFFRSMGGSLGAAVFGSLLANRYAPSLMAALPDELRTKLPASQLESLKNPQALMNPEAAASLQQGLAGFGAQAGELGQALNTAMRVALAGALHEVFLSATIVLVVAVVIVLRLRDIPLRRSNRPTEKEPVAMPVME